MSTGGQARFITNTGGILDISGLTSDGMTAGSIEGGGTILLGAKALTVGLNNLSTEVSGTIGGTGGALIKVGRGMLTLSGANTYTGGTIVNAGTLQLGDGTHTTALAGSNGSSGFPGGAGMDAVSVNNSATFKVLTNASVFGGAGGDGGDAAVNGGNGGNGGEAVSFSAGGFLANAGALSGGSGGDGRHRRRSRRQRGQRRRGNQL